jgi:hypothetical protein
MARTSAALLVDSDIKGLESLVYGFQGVDWRSMACPAPETAAFLVKASGADILVVASREPHDRTLTLLRQLRASEETRTLPLLVMGPASLRPRVAECGSIDFLPTPVFVRDVIVASRILVALHGRDAREPGHEHKIVGTLADFGFLSTIRVMTGLLRSGVMQVERANRRGEILFSEGEIAGAQVGSLQGPLAINHLLLWEDGKVELRLRAVARRGQFNRRVDQVMDEAERFVRDYAHAIQGIGPASSVFEKIAARLTGAAVPSEVAPVLRLCDGRRTLTDVIDESPFRVFDTVRILTRLVELGFLTRRAPRGGAPEPVPALQQFWETARIVGPEDASVPSTAPRPTSAHLAQVDNRIGEVNRRRSQRRASIETPVQGTPIVGMDATGTRPIDGPVSATAAPPVEPATDTRKTRISGSIDIRATADRRHDMPDRRSQPSVTIDGAEVESAPQLAPAAAPVALSAAPAVSPARTGRATGTLQVASPSSQRRATAVSRIASTGISVEIDPELASEANAIVPSDSPAVPLRQNETPASVRALAKEESPTPGATPASTAETTTSPHAAPPIVSAPVSFPAAGAVPAVAGSASAAPAQPDGARTARVTGVLSTSSSQRSVTARNPTPSASVELDPVLMAELGRLERATTPIGPPESDQPLLTGPVVPAEPARGSVVRDTEAAASSSSRSGSFNRATGTLSTAPSARASTNAPKPPRGGLPVALDPGIMREAQRLDTPGSRSSATPERSPSDAGEPHSGSQGAAQVKGQTRGTIAPAAPRPAPQAAEDGHRDPAQASRSTGRISGAFNAVERDFFAREADLYKREAEDNFADLDEPAGKGGPKRPPGRGPAKRQG